jgi:hypothetical protein
MQTSPDPPNNSSGRSRARHHGHRISPARARFLARFPSHEGLALAVAAFENGNYAKVRDLCEGLLDVEQDADVRQAASELLRRIKPDRLVVTILWGSFVLLALVILWAYGQKP